jgi:hypothetical protein
MALRVVGQGEGAIERSTDQIVSEYSLGPRMSGR